MAAHLQARRALPMLAMIPRAAPSGHGDGLAERLRAEGFSVAQRSKAEPVGPTPTSISSTRWARWVSGTASPRSFSSAARWSRSAGTIRFRACASGRRDPARAACARNFAEAYARLQGGWRRRRGDRHRRTAAALGATLRPTEPPDGRGGLAACSEGADVTDTVLERRSRAISTGRPDAGARLGNPPARPGLTARCSRRSRSSTGRRRGG